MAERIWIRQEGRLDGVYEETFRYEDDLQDLIAKHPELIDGEQVRPDDARRWILVAREKGIAPTHDAGARWSLDHLIIDQDARPTLVEAKLRSNSEIHRNIVGQMLEYAAHAAETWTATELRRTFEASAGSQGHSPDELVAELLQDKEERDPDAFWERVSTNLAAKRLRLLFIADRIPDRLARVVEFLNGQMRDIEVLAVEVKRFRGDSGEIFVPRVIGRTAKTRGPAGARLSRDSFLDALQGEGHRDAAERLLAVAGRHGATLRWARHLVSISVKRSSTGQAVTVAWLSTPSGLDAWQRWTLGITYGTKVLEDNDQVNQKLCEILDRWDDRKQVPYAKEAVSKGYKGWTVSYDDAAKNIADLEQRLEKVLANLREH